MNYTSFDIENLQLKYADTLTKVVSLYESATDEISYHINNSTWLLETNQIYIHDTGNQEYMLFGDGNISFISKELLESTTLNEAETDSMWVKIWNVIKSLLSTGWETITHVFHNISGIANGDIASLFLAFGGICELLAIFTVFYPPLHPLNVTLTVLAGLGLVIGGISQCFKAGDKLGTLKHQVERVHESSDSNSNDPIDVFSDGTQHIMMGIAGIGLSSLGIFGGKGVKQTAAKVYQSSVKVGLKKTFKVVFKAVQKKQIEQNVTNLGIKAIIKHESSHFFLHYVAAVIAFFLGSNLTKKKDDGNSWLDLFRGLENMVQNKTAQVSNISNKAKSAVKDKIGGYNSTLDTAVDITFGAVDSIVTLLGTMLSKVVGAMGDLVELIEAFSELFRKSTTEAAYETVYAAGKKEAQVKKSNINKQLEPYKSITISNDSKDFMGSDGFVKMGRSSTSVNRHYKIPIKEQFPSFDGFMKQNINENVMNGKKVKLFEEYVDMKEVEELHEGFVSRGINIAKEGIQEIKAFFNGLQLTMWDKVGKLTKKDLIDIIEGITENVSKHADSTLLDQLQSAQELIIEGINGGKIKTGKQIALAWQEAMDIYIIR